MSEQGSEAAVRDLISEDDVRDVLADSFYASEPVTTIKPKRKKKPKPDHYEVICISMYREDLERLDAKVAELKSAGHRKMSRSGLIRFALDHVDVEKLPRSY